MSDTLKSKREFLPQGISSLSVRYKVFSEILRRRLYPVAENMIGEYRCGLRRNRSTTDRVFTPQQVPEKFYEFDMEIYRLVREFGLILKLVRLVMQDDPQ